MDEHSGTAPVNENLVSSALLPLDPHATFYILPNGMGKDRRTIFSNACSRFRLQLVLDPHDVRFVLVAEQFDASKVFAILKVDPSSDDVLLPILVRSQWLSDSLKAKSLLPLTSEYVLRPALVRKATAPSFSQPTVVGNETKKKPKRTLSDDEPVGGAATQVKQRRYSSDDEQDPESMDVSLERSDERVTRCVLLGLQRHREEPVQEWPVAGPCSSLSLAEESSSVVDLLERQLDVFDVFTSGEEEHCDQSGHHRQTSSNGRCLRQDQRSDIPSLLSPSIDTLLQ